MIGVWFEWGSKDRYTVLSEVAGILGGTIPWHGERHRIELMNRIKFWHFLTGNEDFDMASWWQHIENEPDLIYRTQRA